MIPTRHRRPGGLRALWLATSIAMIGSQGRAGPGGPTIRLAPDASAARAVFEVVGLDASDLAMLARSEFAPAQWAELFAVYAEFEGASAVAQRPPILGSHRVDGATLRFTSRFPLEPGLRYRAVFDPARLPSKTTGRTPPSRPIEATFSLPRPPASSTTTVAQVYPSGDLLPENLLKFYLHFSAPMSRGTAYEHIRLLDASGRAVDMPFLELGEELWDPSGTRFTLLFDPGRIKKGLKPREELGPVLERGKAYTLVIDRDWRDAEGNPLKESFSKAFRAGPEDDERPDPRSWTIAPPASGTEAPLVLTFPEPLDHAMLGRVIAVTDTRGDPVEGRITVEEGETRWRFTPDRAWLEGQYSLVVSTTLEDRAGNSIGRPFEVDAFRPIQRRIESATVKRPFQVRPADRARD